MLKFKKKVVRFENVLLFFISLHHNNKQIEIMIKYNLRISETKTEVITYLGYLIDNCYVFVFNDNSLFYIPTNRLELYKKNGKIKIINK